VSSTVEEIKQRLSIAEVVQGYLELKKAGGRFRARCPFHNERTPSFYVSPDRDSFYCFGCSKGGDIFTFVQEIEGVDFKEALALLAARAGIEIVYSKADKEEKSMRERLREIVSQAIFFYHKTLSEHPDVLAYLARRGLTKETIKDFQLGYAPGTWRALAEYLVTKGVTHSDMVASGLVIKKDGTESYYDRYRNRILFPIADQNGNPIAFSGRIYDELPGADISLGKYINNPQTSLYDKSSVLFGLDKAKQAIRETGTCVIVEGQMDVVMSHQSDVRNCVASSGTALTENHIRTIGRLARTIVFAFDGDEAGIRATERAVLFALNEDLNVRVVLLLDGTDPADLSLSDPTAWKTAVEKSVHIIDFLSQTLLNGAVDDRAKRLLAKERILPYIARLKSSIEQAHFVSRLASTLQMIEEPIWADLRTLRGGRNQPSLTETEKNATKTTSRRSRRASIVRHIIGLRFLISTTHYDERLSGLLEKNTWQELLETFLPKKDVLMFELEKLYPKERRLHEMGALVDELEIEIIQEELRKILKEITADERDGKDDMVNLLTQSQELKRTLDTLRTKIQSNHQDTG